MKELREKLNGHDFLKSLLQISDGWLVGNSIKNILSNEPVKDYDIIVTAV
jgi:hypothetical protein